MSTLKVNPVMYLIAETGNPMSAGKFAAQAAHAAIGAYKLSPDDRLKHIWDECGQQYAKVVLGTDDLATAQAYIEARFPGATFLVIDEGRTEFENDLTPTFLGVRVLDKNRADVAATFGGFKLYRDVVTEKRLADVEKAVEGLKQSWFTKRKERRNAHRSGRNP